MEIVQTKCIVADFSKMCTMAEYTQAIRQKLKGVEVSILVANAGVGIFSQFEALEDPFVHHVDELSKELQYVPSKDARA